MDYIASPTAKLFHSDDSFIRILCGPVMSGKTTACIAELLKVASKAELSVFAVISADASASARAMSDFLTVIHPSFVNIDKNKIKFTFNNGCKVRLHFVSTERELLLLKLTGAWVNDARDVDHSMIMNAISRVGLHGKTDKTDKTDPFIIMDTKPPSTSSWIYSCCEDMQLADWAIFKQPSGLSPFAENLANIPEGYYQRISFGRPQEWIDVYVHGNYGMADKDMIDYTELYPDVSLIDVDLSSQYIRVLS